MAKKKVREEQVETRFVPGEKVLLQVTAAETQEVEIITVPAEGGTKYVCKMQNGALVPIAECYLKSM